MTANNLPLTDTISIPVKDNTENWWLANKSKEVNYEVDLKSLLDPTLLINTFNDLQRYYKSITIYYNYDIETEQEVYNNSTTSVLTDYYTNFSLTESFNPAKEIKNASITINLKDLILRDIPPHNGAHLYHWNHNKHSNPIGLPEESGTSYIYGRTDTDYQLNDYNFNITDNGNIGGWDIEFNNKQAIGFSIINNKNFNWTFYLQVTLGKIEDMWYIREYEEKDKLAYARLYINTLKANIYKIILNSR